MITQTHADMVRRLKKPGDALLAQATPERLDLWHMATGVATEAGELLDAVKRLACYNKSIDRVNVIEELGDLEFYMEGIRQILNIGREETLAANMVKLDKGRYVSGIYSDTQAIARADKQ